MVSLTAQMKKRKMKHYAYGYKPRTVPKGRVIVHNHTQHTIDMPVGVNGFRAWSQLKTEDVVPCKCGWAGLPHYRIKSMKERAPGENKL
jgi:hypothetical protein